MNINTFDTNKLVVISIKQKLLFQALNSSESDKHCWIWVRNTLISNRLVAIAKECSKQGSTQYPSPEIEQIILTLKTVKIKRETEDTLRVYKYITSLFNRAGFGQGMWVREYKHQFSLVHKYNIHCAIYYTILLRFSLCYIKINTKKHLRLDDQFTVR